MTDRQLHLLMIIGHTTENAGAHAGIEVDAMRTVAKAYQDRSLQVNVY